MLLDLLDLLCETGYRNFLSSTFSLIKKKQRNKLFNKLELFWKEKRKFSLDLDVYVCFAVKPIAVSIVNGNNIISDGESARFVCDCFGSNPPADISWLLEGEPIRSSAITVSISI